MNERVTTALPTPDHRQRRLIVSRVRAAAAAGAALLAVVVVTNIVFDDPAFVDRISLENRSDYDVGIEVAGDDERWLPLGVAIQRCTTSFDLVIDQGPNWRIQFQAQGTPGGRVTVTREDLERTNWTFQIPSSVEAELKSRHAPLPPVQRCGTAASTE